MSCQSIGLICGHYEAQGMRITRLFGIGMFACLVIGVLATGAVIDNVVADHDEDGEGFDVDDNEVWIVHNISVAEETTDQLTYEISFHIGSDLSRFEVNVSDDYVTSIEDVDGFTEGGYRREYTWDGFTDEPSITIHREANVSAEEPGEYRFVRTDEWATTFRPYTPNTAWSQADESVNRVRTIHTDEGVAGTRYAYLGEYDRYEFTADEKSFELVVSNASAFDRSIDDIEQSLTGAAEHLAVNDEIDEYTAFVVPDPTRCCSRWSNAGDILLHEDAVEQPARSMYVGYVVNEQSFDTNDSAAWLDEAVQEYYRYLLMYKDGEIDYADFYDEFTPPTELDSKDVIPADPETWEERYDGGDFGLNVLAAIDVGIRENTATGSFTNVFAALNEYDGEITHDVFEELVLDAGSAGLSDVLERQVNSTVGPIERPGPADYRIIANQADPRLTISGEAIRPGESTSLEITVQNSGEDPIRSPLLDVDLGDDFEEMTAASSSNITMVDGGILLDSIEPGDAVTEEYGLRTSALAEYGTTSITVEYVDRGGNERSAEATFDIVSEPRANLSGPTTVSSGESVTLDASDSEDETGISHYEWNVSGPTTLSTTTTDPTIEETFDQPGEYEITVTVVTTAGLKNSTDHTLTVEQTADDDGPGFTILIAIGTLAIGTILLRWRLAS